MDSEYDSIVDELNRIGAEVARIRNSEEEKLADFAHRLYATLEAVPADDRGELEATIGVTAGLEPQTPMALADRLNSNPRRVKDGIELLKEWDMPLIEFVDEEDNTTHWFKEAQ